MKSPHPLHRRLLGWFDRHRRDLPWRRDRDPYRVWVSEVMLQQTQVATVVPYFERFLARFPTLADLAAADEADVLRLWEGLGYYRRARDLHRAARRLVAEQGGQIPADPAALAGLPGMGEYTRNAVLSQAFDLRLPILEANSQRVLSRLSGREVRLGPELTTIKHGITRYRITLVCFEAEHAGGEFASPFYPTAAWLAPADLAGYPVSAPQRRLARAAAEPGGQRRLF